MNRTRLVGYFRKYWRSEIGFLGTVMDALLFPGEILYSACRRMRRSAYEKNVMRSYRLEVPVVSVGNIAVGGTGKTPFSRWVFEHLLKMGFVPGLVSGDLAQDEHELHEIWNTDGIFVIHKTKKKGADLAIERGANFVVVDDGFQHFRLKRDVDVVMVAAEHLRFVRCFPRGCLRESFDALTRADMVIVSRKTCNRSIAQKMVEKVEKYISSEKIGQVHFKFASWRDIDGNKVNAPCGRNLIVTSIAEPEEMITMVKSLTTDEPEALIYTDHYEFKRSDIEHIKNNSKGSNIIITEKDAVKLRAFTAILDNVFVLELDMKWENGEQRMIELLKKQERQAQ